MSKKKARSLNLSGDIIADDKQSSLERLQKVMAMIWIDNLSGRQKKQHIADIEKVYTFDDEEHYINRLYKYYELYKWPNVLIKLEKLRKKYQGEL